MAKPNKPYLAGKASIPDGTTDYDFLNQVFATQVAAAAVTSWRDLIVGVANTFVFTFNQQITVKYAQNIYDATTGKLSLTKGDAAVWRNPTPSTLYRSFREIQKRENHTFAIDEIYITNGSGSTAVVDVEIFADNNGPFTN